MKLLVNGESGGRKALRFGASAALLLTLAACCAAAAPPRAAAQVAAPRDDLDRAAEAIRRDDLARAETELSAALRARPRDANALNLLGVVRARQRRNAEAEQLFLRALASSPALVGARVNLGLLYLDANDDERALRAFTEAARLAPDHPEVNYRLAVLREARREFAPALAHLEKIPREARGVEHLHLALKCYLALGRSAEAAAIAAALKRPDALAPDDAASFAALFAAHGRNADALDILNAALTRAPDSFAVLYNLGAVHLQANESERAEQFYSRALAAKPEDAATLRALTRVWRGRGDLEKSFAYSERALRAEPDSPAALYDYGWTALNLDRLPEAIDALGRLHALRPDEPEYVYTLAVARFHNNEDERALALLGRYVELKPRDARGHYVLGVMLRLMARPADARDALARSFALRPTADAAHHLGLISYDEDDAAQAVVWQRRAVELDAAHAPSRAALGMALAKQKNFAAARAELERAVALDPQDLTARYQLGLVLTRLGETERARVALAEAERLRAEQRHRPREGLRLAAPPQR